MQIRLIEVGIKAQIIKHRMICKILNQCFSYTTKIFIKATAKLSGAVYCYRSCLWLWCLQRAGGRCQNLTTASARGVCVSLGAFSFVYLTYLAQHSSRRTRSWRRSSNVRRAVELQSNRSRIVVVTAAVALFTQQRHVDKLRLDMH